MVVVLLGTILLAALVFYVMNLGRSVQARVVTQHAADATASAGAGSMARSLNTVAMSNVEITRLLAEVNVLDATDEVIHPAYHEAASLRDALEAYLPDGAGNGLTSAEAAVIREQMAPVLEDLRFSADQLGAVKARFVAPDEPEEYATPAGNFDMTTVTHYHPPAGGRGQLWRAMLALDEVAQATMQTYAERAQRHAIEAGEVNLDGDAGAAVMLPIVPRLPWQRGTFEDFRRPLTQGRLPEAVDHPVIRRGPFDVLFGWRLRHRERTGDGEWVPGPDAGGPDGPGGVGPDGEGGYWNPPPTWETTGYQTHGPQHWMLHHGHDRRLRHIRFHTWRNQAANIKLQYLFGPSGAFPENAPPNEGDPPTRTYRPALWRTDWNEVTGIADTGTDDGGEARTIRETWFFVVRLESDVPRRSPNFLDPGTYRLTETNHPIVRLTGDWDVPDNPCDVFANDPRVWQDQLERWRNECEQFANMDSDLQAQWRDARFTRLDDGVYRFESPMQRGGEELWQVVWYFCLGVDVGEPVPVRNPHNFSAGAELPAPIHFDHEVMQPDELTRRELLTVLGVVRREDKATLWSRMFDRGRADPNHLAIAQARVFNNHSWDLWTQMWHAQLEPVTGYSDWLDRLEVEMDGISDETLREIEAALRRAESLAPEMLNH